MGWSPGAGAALPGSVSLAYLAFTPPIYEPAPQAKVVAQTFPPWAADSATSAALVSQTVVAVSIGIPVGKTIHSITFVAGTTALVTGVNQIFGLYDLNLNRLAQTNDDGANAWAASTPKTLVLTADFVTQYDGLYYLACLVNATTVPTLWAESPPANIAQPSAPFYCARYQTAVTALPASLVFSASTGTKPYAYVSSP